MVERFPRVVYWQEPSDGANRRNEHVWSPQGLPSLSNPVAELVHRLHRALTEAPDYQITKCIKRIQEPDYAQSDLFKECELYLADEASRQLFKRYVPSAIHTALQLRHSEGLEEVCRVLAKSLNVKSLQKARGNNLTRNSIPRSYRAQIRQLLTSEHEDAPGLRDNMSESLYERLREIFLPKSA